MISPKFFDDVDFFTSFLKTKGKIFVDGYSFNSYIKVSKSLFNAIKNTFLIGGIIAGCLVCDYVLNYPAS